MRNPRANLLPRVGSRSSLFSSSAALPNLFGLPQRLGHSSLRTGRGRETIAVRPLALTTLRSPAGLSPAQCSIGFTLNSRKITSPISVTNSSTRIPSATFTSDRIDRTSSASSVTSAAFRSDASRVRVMRLFDPLDLDRLVLHRQPQDLDAKLSSAPTLCRISFRNSVVSRRRLLRRAAHLQQPRDIRQKRPKLQQRFPHRIVLQLSRRRQPEGNRLQLGLFVRGAPRPPSLASAAPAR